MRIKQFSFKGEPFIEVMNLGDVHRGNVAFDADLWQRAVEYVKNTPHCYWLSTGDLLESSLASGKHYDYDAMSPQKEFDLLIDELLPISDKCLGLVSSNHSVRHKKLTGKDIDRDLSRILHIDYYGFVGTINITVGGNAYYTVLHHGHGAKSRRLDDMILASNLYMDGHTHTYSHNVEEYNTIDRKRCKMKVVHSSHVTTGHCLIWDKSYAPETKYRPKSSGFACVTLQGGGENNKRIDAKLWR